MFCAVDNIDVGSVIMNVNNVVVFLTILLTIQNIIFSYCHITRIDTILYILSTILQGMGLQMEFATTQQFLPVPAASAAAATGGLTTRPSLSRSAASDSESGL